jgi:chromosome segregation ATPase
VNAERPLSSDNAHAEIRRLEEVVAIKDAEYAAMVAKMSEDIKNISKENEMRANMYECNAAERPSQAIITDNENEIARLREKLRIYDQDIYEMRINMRTTEAKSKEADAQNEALMAELSAMRNQMYSMNTSSEVSNQEYIEKLRIMERRCRELEVDSEEKSRLYKKKVLGFEEQFEDLRSVYAREKRDKENILIELREKEMMLKEMRDKKKSSNEHINIVINEIDPENPEDKVEEKVEERNVSQPRPSTPFNLGVKHASNEVLKIEVNNEFNDPEFSDEIRPASDNESDDDEYSGKNPKITSV